MHSLMKLLRDTRDGKISAAEALPQLKALLDQTGGVRRFQYDQPYVQDHLVLGKPVLLGVTYVALAIEALTHAQHQQVAFSRFLFKEPLTLEQGGDALVFPQQEDAGISLVAYQHDQTKIVAEAQVVPVTQSPPPLSLADFQTGKTVDGSQLYAAQTEAGVQHGPSLFTLGQIIAGEQSLLAELALTSAMQAEKSYPLHPALADGAIFAAVSVLAQPEEPFIPFMIEKVSCYKTGLVQGFAHARLRSQSSELITCDITLCDGHGEVYLELEGFSCKRVPTQHQSKPKTMRVAEQTTEGGLARWLREQIEPLLEEGDAYDEAGNFLDMGLDSNHLVTFSGDLERELNIELYPTVFFEYPSPEKFAAYLGKTFPEVVSRFQAEAPVDAAPLQQSAQPVEPMADQTMAVIGMAGVFPGSPNLQTFWDHLLSESNLISEVPADHFDMEPWFDPDPEVEDRSYCKWGGFIENIHHFDAAFFKVSPREAALMDPQLRYLMQVIYQASEDAGYANRIRGTRTGVYVGACFRDYQQEMDRLGKPAAPHDGTGNAATMLANRPSFHFNLTGPSMTVDTACSSSLVALHLAISALARRECEAAFVCGANALMGSWHFRYFSSLGALSHSGRCHSFDSRADGYVPGEAVAAMLLKPLRDAERDRDRIHALITGSAVNHGGYTPSITAPSTELEARVITDAWERAGLDPETLTYLEAHGTGTQLGDPIEVNALLRSFGASTQKRQFCALGSAKAHIGHTEGAAGITGVLKVILSMRAQIRPAMPAFEEINPYVRLDEGPLFINQKPIPWPSEAYPRRAGVSSFGFGGAYAHVVVEEFVAQTPTPVKPSQRLFPLSAATEERLRARAAQLVQDLDREDDLSGISRALHLREHHPHRLVIVASNRETLILKLQGWLDGKQDQAVVQGHVAKKGKHIASGTPEKQARAFVDGAALEAPEGLLPFLQPYPFVGEHHRFQINQPSTPSSLPVHPLMPRGNDIPLEPSAFYFQDHRVLGQPVLPGVVYAEIFAQKGLAEGLELPLRLSELTWLQPVIGDERASLRFEGQDGAYRLCNGQGQVHARAMLTQAEQEPTPVDLSALQQGTVLDQTACYQLCSAKGIQYGPSFQRMEQVWQGQGQVLAQLTPQTDTQWLLHPATTDAALQAAMTLADPQLDPALLYLPFSTRSFVIYQSSQQARYAHVRLTSEAGAPNPVFQVSLLDQQGQPLVVLHDFAVRTFDGGVRTHCLRPIRQEVPALPKADTFEGTILVLGTQGEAQALSRLLPTTRVVCVVSGSSFVQLGPDAFQVDLKDERPFAPVFQTMDTPPQAVVHLWSCTEESNEQTGVLALAALVAHCTGIPLVSLHPANAAGLALAAFARSAVMESSQMRLRMVALIKVPGTVQLAQMILNHLIMPEGAPIALVEEGGRYYIPTLETMQPQEQREPNFSSDGVYLITGGSGGLAALFARHLTAQGAHLVLCGHRSRPDTSEFPAHLITATQANVCDRMQLQSVLDEIRAKGKPLKGIIHAAGVRRDGLLATMQRSQHQTVLAPKLDGTRLIDELTANDPLDFFVCFSSIAGICGNAGQSTYAYANAYMDHYMAEREQWRRQGMRNGISLAIAWPLWTEGGMTISTRQQADLRQKTGLHPLPTKPALEVFDRALSSGSGVVAVVHGNTKRFDTFYQESGMLPAEPDQVAPSEADEVLQQAAIDWLKQHLAQETGMSAARIRAEEPLETYGIDSVMISSLNRVLENAFGKLSKTLFFEYRSIAELASYLSSHHAATLRQLTGVSSAPAKLAPPQRKQPTQTVPKIQVQASANEPIAIIGVAGRYPMAPDLDTFWKNLSAGSDCITEIPRQRWNHAPFFDAKPQAGKVYSKWGGFIEDFDAFDPLLFGISPREALQMDPQERHFLEVSRHTLEDAGYGSARYRPREVGVFVGVMWGHYQLYGNATGEGPVTAGSSFASIANRVSYCHNFSGPSMAIDTMCSSSLTAVHLAIESLRKGECQMALAGGVNLNLHPAKYLFLSQGRFAASDGRCRSFGADGDGYVPGEGVGAVLLKPLSQALQDSDQILGQILGSSLNHGGKTNGFTVPNPIAQGAAIADALQAAEVQPRQINYLEAHGTGTSLGDPIEITGLDRAFRANTTEQGFCPIGSAKSNIGHLESAAGIAGLTKILLQFKHQTLAPSIHAHPPNPNIDFQPTAFRVQQELAPWNPSNAAGQSVARIAGLSSFGAGGSNAHLVLQEGQAQKPVEIPGPYLFVLSARTEERLKAYAQGFLQWLQPARETQDPQHTCAIITEILGMDADEMEWDMPLAESGLDRVQLALLAERLDVPAATLDLDKTLADLLPQSTEKATSREVDWTALAYTLQVGREPMNWRLAIVFDSGELLRTKLQGFVTGNGDQDWAVGEVDLHGSDDHFMLEGKAGEAYLATLYEQRDLQRMAHLWVKGHSLDWVALTGGLKPNRMSLPTYPYEKRRFWLETSTKGTGSPALHPLLDTNISSLDHHRYTKQLRITEPVVGHHHVDGKALLPGVAFMEMALAAFTRSQGKTPTALSDVVWSAPLIVDDELTVEIELARVGHRVTYEITGADRRVCGRGSFDDIHHPVPDDLDIEAIKQRCNSESVDPYQIYTQAGFDYGPAFRATQETWTGAGEGLVRLLLPKEAEDLDTYRLHPYLADAALRSVFWMHEERSDESPQTRVPFSLGRLTLHGEMRDHGYAHARLLSEPGADVARYQVTLTDDTGRVLVCFHDFKARAMKNTRPEVLYFAPRWQATPPTANQPSPESTLIFSGDRYLAKTLDSNAVTWVQPGEIDAQNTMDYRRLFERLGEIPATLVFNGFPSTEGGFLNTQPLGALLALFKALDGLKRTTRCIYVYGNNPAQRTISETVIGFARALTPVNHRFQLVTCEIDHFGPEVNLRHELTAPGIRGGTAIRYAQGQRFQEFNEPLSLIATPDNGLRQGGVYLITGGAGGLGRVFATYLCKQYKAKVVLCGRSPLGPDHQTLLENLQALGGNAIYVSGDITQRETVDQIIDQTQARFGALHGIFHAAGVDRTVPIGEATQADMDRVLAPKVMGTQILDEATAHLDLDLFVLFSSISSTMGDFGLGSYAAANRFLDAFAQEREHQRKQEQRKGRTLSIGWPFWAEGGMTLPEDMASLYLDYSGMTELSTEDGLSAFEACLAGNEAVVTVAVGKRPTIERLLLPKKAVKAPPKQKQTTTAAVSGISQQAQVEDHLKLLLGKVLHMDRAEISASDPLEDYGIDSVLIMELNGLLEEEFGAMPRTLLFEHPTLASLATWLVNERKETVQLRLQVSNEPVQHQTLQQTDNPAIAPIPTAIPQSTRETIAVIGMAGRYPQAPSIYVFWKNLAAGRDCIEEVPANRWSHPHYYDPQPGLDGKTYCKWGGFIEDADCFDAAYFKITPHFAAAMDPQERLFLENARHVLDDGGYSRDSLTDQRVGVYAGVMWPSYALAAAEATGRGQQLQAHADYSSVANRVSWFFNFRGPSMAIDTACSSSLLAVHLACRDLREGTCDYALAGGVNLSIHAGKYVRLSKLRMLSPTGRCHGFGSGADGYVPGEGVGAVLLKPLTAAQRDGDRLLGVIAGSAVNHGGHTHGYSVPSPAAHGSLVRAALDDAQLKASSITYIEAHGTGTALGDPVEHDGLCHAFRQDTQANHFCALGTVKSNIGHLEGAAGISALTKVLLQLQHGWLAPTLHVATTNPHIDFENSPFALLKEGRPWTRPQVNGQSLPRRAGISSFGAGGTNVHVILEEPPQRQHHSNITRLMVFPFSAGDAGSLHRWLTQLLETLKPETKFMDLAHTLHRREPMVCRLALVASSIDDLKTQLTQHLTHDWQPTMVSERACREKPKAADTTRYVETMRTDLKQVATAWEQGHAVDWLGLFPKGGSQVMSLPPYPFAKQRHWLPMNKPHTHSKQPILDPKAFYLRDHLVQGQPTLPGVMYLELVAQNLSPESTGVLEISDLLWGRPIIVDRGPISLSIQEEQTQDGTRFRICSGTDQLHASGRWQWTTSLAQSVDLDVLQARCPHLLEKEEIYTTFDTFGLGYGATFQVADNVWVGDGELLAQLSLPDHCLEEFHTFQLHPSLLDGALQTVFHLQTTDCLHLPFSLGRMRRYAPLAPTVMVHTRKSTQPQEFELSLYSPNGDLLVTLERFKLREVPKQTQTTTFFQTHWKVTEPPEPLTVPETARVALLASDTFPLKDLEASLQHANLTHLKPDFSNETTVLAEWQGAAPTHVILDGSGFTTAQEPVLAVFRLVRVIQQRFPESPMRLLYLYLHGPKDAGHQAVSGLATTLKQYRCRLTSLGMDTYNTNQICAELFDPTTQAGSDIRYTASQRHLRALEPISPNSTWTPKPGGVYLITGGAGSLGRIFARYLANLGCRLVLTGRSPVDTEKEALVRELRDCCGEAIYRPLDVCDPDAVCALVTEMQQLWQRLDGIFHAAGISPKATFLETDVTAFAQVLAPKITGTLNLVKASDKEHPPDLILFSSIASRIGDFGAGCYAAANRFQDAIAENASNRRILSINWPLWDTGGMSLPPEEQERYFQLAGLRALTEAQGLEAFAQIMATEARVAVVAHGEPKRYSRALGLSAQSAASKAQPTNLHHLRQSTEAYLRTKLGQVMGSDGSNIDPQQALHNYGVDSIVLMDLADNLTRDLGTLEQTDLFEHENLSELTEYLLNNYRPALEKMFPGQVPKTVATKVGKKKHQLKNPTLPSASDIAIIGMSGRFPLAEDYDTFWANLANGQNCITQTPQERQLPERYAGYLKDVFHFDPQPFGLNDEEVVQMDPETRLMLENVWITLEDAAYNRARIAEENQSNVGLFVGCMYRQYPWLQQDTSRGEELGAGAHWSLANRLSWFFDFQGPSVALDTACSSGLSAVWMACESLRAGTCSMAVAGAVNLHLHESKFRGLQGMGLLGTTRESRSLGQGDGYVPGEGVGSVLLKPLALAEKDGDKVLAVIKGGSTNHGGHTARFTMASPAQQSLCAQKALELAGLKPQQLNYIELAANGSPLGDLVEMNGLKRLFGEKPKATIPVGSVKSNIGHLEAASGISQLFKVILQMQHGYLAPSINGNPPNERLNLKNSPFHLQEEGTPWPKSKQPFRALIASFGAGGANAHLVLQQAPKQMVETREKAERVFVFSAPDSETLRMMAGNFVQAIDETWDLAALEKTLLLGRERFSHRLAVTASSPKQLRKALKQWLAGKKSRHCLSSSPEKQPERPKKTQPLAERALQWLETGETWTVATVPPISVPNYPFQRKAYSPFAEQTPKKGFRFDFTRIITQKPEPSQGEPAKTQGAELQPISTEQEASQADDRLAYFVGFKLKPNSRTKTAKTQSTEPQPETTSQEASQADNRLAYFVGFKLKANQKTASAKVIGPPAQPEQSAKRSVPPMFAHFRLKTPAGSTSAATEPPPNLKAKTEITSTELEAEPMPTGEDGKVKRVRKLRFEDERGNPVTPSSPITPTLYLLAVPQRPGSVNTNRHKPAPLEPMSKPSGLDLTTPPKRPGMDLTAAPKRPGMDFTAPPKRPGMDLTAAPKRPTFDFTAPPKPSRAKAPTPTVAPNLRPKPVAVAVATPDPEYDLQGWITHLVSQRVGIPANQIDPKANIMNMGADSNVVLSLTRELEEHLDIELDPILLFDYATIEELCAFLKQRKGGFN